MPEGSIDSYMPTEAINALPVSPYAANLIGQTPVTGTDIDGDGYLTSNTSEQHSALLFREQT